MNWFQGGFYFFIFCHTEPWQTIISLSYIVNIMAADDLAVQWYNGQEFMEYSCLRTRMANT